MGARPAPGRAMAAVVAWLRRLAAEATGDFREAERLLAGAADDARMDLPLYRAQLLVDLARLAKTTGNGRIPPVQHLREDALPASTSSPTWPGGRRVSSRWPAEPQPAHLAGWVLLGSATGAVRWARCLAPGHG